MTFAVDGTTYEIDLSANNAASSLRNAVAAWSNGHTVSARGRIAATVVDAYTAAH